MVVAEQNSITADPQGFCGPHWHAKWRMAVSGCEVTLRVWGRRRDQNRAAAGLSADWAQILAAAYGRPTQRMTGAALLAAGRRGYVQAAIGNLPLRAGGPHHAVLVQEWQSQLWLVDNESGGVVALGTPQQSKCVPLNPLEFLTCVPACLK